MYDFENILSKLDSISFNMQGYLYLVNDKGFQKWVYQSHFSNSCNAHFCIATHVNKYKTLYRIENKCDKTAICTICQDSTKVLFYCSPKKPLYMRFYKTFLQHYFSTAKTAVEISNCDSIKIKIDNEVYYLQYYFDFIRLV